MIGRDRTCLVGAGGQVDLADHLGVLVRADRLRPRHRDSLPLHRSASSCRRRHGLVIEAMLKIASFCCVTLWRRSSCRGLLIQDAIGAGHTIAAPGTSPRAMASFTNRRSPRACESMASGGAAG